MRPKPGPTWRNETGYAVLLLMRTAWSSRLWRSRAVAGAGQVVVRVAHAGRREAVIEPRNPAPGDRIHRPGDLVWKRADGPAETSPVVGRREPSHSDVRGSVRAGGPSGRRAARLDHLHPDLGRPVRGGAAGTDRRDLRSGQGSRRMAGRGETPRVTWRAVQSPASAAKRLRSSAISRRAIASWRSVRICCTKASTCARAKRGRRSVAVNARDRDERLQSLRPRRTRALRHLFLLVAISIAGVVAFLMLGRAEDPSFTIKQMTVVTAWPGATAKEMEELVAERLEKRMQELRWYDRTETFTRPGLAFTTVFLRDSTPPTDVPSSSIRRGRNSATRRSTCRLASSVRW